MPRFTQENVISVIELHELMADWGYDLDLHGGSGVSRLCTEDCNYFVGGKLNLGHAAIDAFYAARNERVRTQQKDGVRTQRHTITNLRTRFDGADRATVEFLLVNYSAAGHPPVTDLVGPTIVAECRMECRREDGDWRIALFDSRPLFVGNDPFLNAAVVKP